MSEIIEGGQVTRNGAARREGGKRRRILMVSTACPFPPANGYSMRLWAILNGLAAENWETDIICFGDPPKDFDLSELRRLCHSVDVIPHPQFSMSARADVSGRLSALFSRRPYAVAGSRSLRMEAAVRARLGEVDAVLCEETNLLQNLPSRLPVPLIVDHHNAEYLLLERYVTHERNPLRACYGSIEARNTRRWETAASLRANLVLACSDHDRSLFSNLSPGILAMTAPNVIDVEAYSPRDRDDGKTLLYTGGMGWFPSRDAVAFFVDRVLPEVRQRVPQVRFVVASNGGLEKFRSRFCGYPEVVFEPHVGDMRSEIAGAAVCVVPLRIGSGTRLKILEAAAMEKAIVTTPIGTEGLDFRDGEDILIAEDPQAFAAATITALNDRALRRRLGRAARARVEAQYGYPALRAALRHALDALTATEGASHAALRNS